MSNENFKTAAAVAVGAVGGELLADWLKGKPAQAGNMISLDEPTMRLLAAILERCESIEQMLTILEAIAAALGGGGTNPNAWKAFNVTLETAGTPQRFPEYVVPYKCKLKILAHTTNLGILYLAPTEADTAHALTRIPLVAGQAIELEIDKTNEVYMDGSSNGDIVACFIEQRR